MSFESWATDRPFVRCWYWTRAGVACCLGLIGWAFITSASYVEPPPLGEDIK
jgi:hypothetical protein